MKKILSNLMLVAAAAMAFSACQKTEMVEPETSQEVMLTFASEKPAFDDETKTEWTGETIQWSAGDKISVAYTVNGNWQNASGDASGDAKLYKSDALEAATETAKFNVSASFEGTTEGTHVFYGVYPAPSSTSFADAPVATLTVPSIQTPGAASFDGSADLMTGVSVGEFTSLPTEPISMKWTRLVAHANITLKALNGVTAGETVSSITLTAQEGANLVGSQKVDITANTVVNNNNESNVLELNGGNLSIDASGNIEFWACVLPETLTSLAVVVETNKATYTREITGISKTFKQNARNTLSIKMNEATRVAKEEESWVLVTPADGLTEGTYVLVVSTDTKTGALVSTNGTSAAPKFNTSISVSDNTLNGVTEAMQFDLSGTTGNYKLAVTGQTTDYLYTTNGNNGVRVGTNTNNVWTITQHESNADAFVFKCNATSRYLGVYNNADWRCYTAYDADNFTNGSGSSQIYLYKKQSGPEVPDTTPSITVDETLELTSAESEGTISVTYKNLEALDAAAYSDADCTVDCDWLVAVWENDAVSYIAAANEGEERTAYIQIYALDAEANEYTKVITVTQAAYVDPSVIEELTVEEFLAKEVSTEVFYQLTGTIKNLTNTTYGNFDLVDETGSVYVYGLKENESAGNQTFANLGLKEGDVVTIIGPRSDYNGTAQVGTSSVKAYYVSHLTATDAPAISFADNTVTIESETGATIYYTTDGNDPTTSSDVYSAPFEVTEANSPMTVKAIAVADGKVASVVASKTCTYVDPNAGGELVTETLNITGTTGDLASDNSSISWEGTYFTCINEKANSTTAIRTSDSAHYRVYANSKLNFSAKNGTTFNKLVLTCISSYVANTTNVTYPDNLDVAVSGTTVTITCTEPVSEISLTIKKQIRISKVESTLQ